MKAPAMCGGCGKRRATMYTKRGGVKRSPGHDVCRQCWRAFCDRTATR
jgi:hypothetical protein